MTRDYCLGLCLFSVTMGCSGADGTVSANDGSLRAGERPAASHASIGLVGSEPVKASIAGRLDCSGYDGFTAAIATWTVDCTGTIDGGSFVIDDNGYLVRNFNRCVSDQSLLSNIDSMLSLQRRGERLPLAQACIAGRWATWKEMFDRLGINECPTWRKDSVIGAPTADRIASLAQAATGLLESAPAAQPEAALEHHQNHVYAVELAPSSLPARCDSAGECAAQCAGGFAGFVIEPQGDSVLTDPAYWLLDTTYPTADQDPFLKNMAYYHPMSYYGPLPGTQFAHRARVQPCPNCRPETCSYYAGIHIKLPLRLDCLDPADYSTCVGYCAP